MSVLLLDEDESILPFERSTLRLTTGGGNDIFPSLPVTGWSTYGGTKLQVSSVKNRCFEELSPNPES